ncbi:MAG: hypothetical protein AB1505_03410 [Candidatus Latescibacterota bacterium]
MLAHLRRAAWLGLLALLVAAGLLCAVHHVLSTTHDPGSCLLCTSLQGLCYAAAVSLAPLLAAGRPLTFPAPQRAASCPWRPRRSRSPPDC